MTHDPHDESDAPDPRFAALMDEARAHYNVPARTPDFDAMWTRVERDAFSAPVSSSHDTNVIPLAAARSGRVRSAFARYGTWAGLAAGLLIGVAVGRGTVGDPSITSDAGPAPAATLAAIPGPVDAVVDPTTATYLGQTAALLVSLPAEPRTANDSAFVNRARLLLSTTRLLLDAPGANDPRTRALLEDLELVLAQIVGIPSGDRGAELELITQAVEQRELLSRLNSAASGAPAPAVATDD